VRLVPDHQSAIVLLTNGSTGRAMYRSFFAELMESLLGITFPQLHLQPSPDAAGDLPRFTHAWPDRKIEVTATASGLVIESDQGKTDLLPLDDRAFLADASDPDDPTLTFGAVDRSGCPRVLYFSVRRLAGTRRDVRLYQALGRLRARAFPRRLRILQRGQWRCIGRSMPFRD